MARKSVRSAPTAPAPPPALPAEVKSGRSRAISIRSRIETPYHAASTNPLIPTVPGVGPIGLARYQPIMSRLARQLYRNDPIIRKMIVWQGQTYIGTGPTPASRYPELDELFVRACQRFDSRGNKGWGAWLRDDVRRPHDLDGEVFIRVRDRRPSDLARDRLTVPLVFQSLVSEFCPIAENRILSNGSIVCGIEFDQIERRRQYWLRREHPLNLGMAMTGVSLVNVPASEVMHYFTEPMPGSPRGEVPIASAILRAIKLATYEDAEARRKLTATLFSTLLTVPAETDATVDRLASEEEIEEMLSQIELTPGAIIRLPNGIEPKFATPADTPGSYDTYMRFGYMLLAASISMPPHELTGDYSTINERMARYAGLAMQRTADCERERMETQVLNPMWAEFVDKAEEVGLWTPPPNRPDWEKYQVEWDWPPIMLANLNQELNAMISAINAGLVDRDTVARNYFGNRGATVDRRQARAAARADAIGLQHQDALWQADTPVAERIAALAAERETAEQTVDEQSAQEDSALD